MKDNYIITIGSQLGSGGREIGEKLASRLAIRFFDKELIDLAAEQSGLCKDFFEKADEKTSQGVIGGLFGMRFPFARSEERRVGKECVSECESAGWSVHVNMEGSWR